MVLQRAGQLSKVSLVPACNLFYCCYCWTLNIVDSFIAGTWLRSNSLRCRYTVPNKVTGAKSEAFTWNFERKALMTNICMVMPNWSVGKKLENKWPNWWALCSWDLLWCLDAKWHHYLVSLSSTIMAFSGQVQV